MTPEMNASECERSLLSIRLWMERRLTDGPIETRGVNPPVNGHSHPSGYAAVMIPDWELRQKLDVIKLAEGYVSSIPEDVSAAVRLLEFVRLMRRNIEQDACIVPIKRAMYVGMIDVAIAEFESASVSKTSGCESPQGPPGHLTSEVPMVAD